MFDLISDNDFFTILDAYIEAGMWCWQIEHLDCPEEERDLCEQTVRDWITANEKIVAEALDFDTAQRFGHDLYLTSRRHGAGFWDGDWDDQKSPTLGKRLTDLSHQISECDDFDLWCDEQNQEEENA